MSLLSRLRNTFRPQGSHGRAIDDELAFHLDERTRDLIGQGLSPTEARRQAALALIGLYGTLSSDVAQRTREIGVRLALGATPTEVVRELVGRGLWVTLLGLLPGLALAAWVTRALASLLYGVRPLDPFSFAFPTILLLLCAALASFLPARRAATIDPSEALRYE